MSSSDEYLNIDTPENVAFGYEVAGIGSRFLAALIDTLILLALQFAVSLVMLLILQVTVFQVFDFFNEDNPTTSWLIAIFILISFLIFWGYYIFFEAFWNGQSPGKRQVKLRVIRTDGTPITTTEAVIRNLVRIIDFLPAYYGIGVVVMFIDSQSRRLGDFAAGTLVVREQTTVTLESLNETEKLTQRTLDMAAHRPTEISGLPFERLDSRTLHIAEDYLKRRYQLENRYQLARQILDMLYTQLEYPPPHNLTSTYQIEDHIRYIIQAANNRHTT